METALLLVEVFSPGEKNNRKIITLYDDKVVENHGNSNWEVHDVNTERAQLFDSFH